jgi:transposase
VELLEELELEPHLVHPSRCKAIASARLKNDKVDARTLAQLLRADLLPEAWIAPPEIRDLRALLRHRASLVRLATGLKNRVHAVLAKIHPSRPRPRKRLRCGSAVVAGLDGEPPVATGQPKPAPYPDGVTGKQATPVVDGQP